jgi:hypothetical protein
MQVYQFSEALRDSNSADQAGAALKEQIAAIERRLQDIDQEVARLQKSALQGRFGTPSSGVSESNHS